MNTINTTMNKEKLNKLLDRYYEGLSTSEEENTLREYFSGEDILPGYEAEKEIFAHFSSVRSVPEPEADFEERMLRGVFESEKGSRSLKVERQSYRKLWIGISGIAASILIAISAYFYTDRSPVYKDSYSDPAIAYAETRKILFDVSSKMNKAKSSLEPVGKMNKMNKKSFSALNKSTSIIVKNLKNLENLEGKESLSKEIKNN